MPKKILHVQKKKNSSWNSIISSIFKFIKQFVFTNVALKISVVYFVVGVLWILLSDKILAVIVRDINLITTISMFKGWVYVSISSILIFHLIYTSLKKIRKSEKTILKNYEELAASEEKIKQQYKELQNYRDNLEIIVSERTATLENTLSEMTLMEDALKKATFEANSASRAKSNFLANMSHEIRTPLNAIIGLNQLLMQTGLNSKQMDYCQKMLYSSENLLGIINDILDFSKIESGKLELADNDYELLELFGRISGILYHSAYSKRLKLILKVDPQIPLKLSGDEVRLGQVLLNLSANALKFTKEGNISISAKLSDIDDTYAYILFTVEDTGIGIPNDQQAKLFHAFSQGDSSTTREYGGTGLGLAICKAIVEEMGGDIELSSHPGKGTRLSFEIRQKLAADGRKISGNTELSGKNVFISINNIEVKSNIYLQLSALGLNVYDKNSSNFKGDSIINSDIVLIDFHNACNYCSDNKNSIKYTEKFIFIKETTDIGGDPSYNLPEFSHSLTYPFGLIKLKTVIEKIIFKHNLLRHQKNPVNYENMSSQVSLTGKVLVVEDNEINLSVVEECLISAGLLVKKANDGYQAVEMSLNENFDIILMDIHMPSMDGIMAAKEIRKLKLDHPPVIIALTADAEKGMRENALKSGMDDFLSKPLNHTVLLSTIQKWLRNGKITLEENIVVSAPSGLPNNLPGLEIKDGLERINKNLSRYLSILNLFYESIDKYLFDMGSCIDRKDFDKAANIAHTLKGVSGTIGANKVMNLSTALEANLKSNPDTSSLIEQLFILESALNEVSDSIKKVLVMKENNTSPTAITHDVNDEDLNKLLQLVKQNNTEALRLFNEISYSLKKTEFSDLACTLENSLMMFDWHSAQNTLNELLLKMNPSLKQP